VLAAFAPSAVRLPPGAANKGEHPKAQQPEDAEEGYVSGVGVGEPHVHATAIGRQGDGDAFARSVLLSHDPVVSCWRKWPRVYRSVPGLSNMDLRLSFESTNRAGQTPRWAAVSARTRSSPPPASSRGTANLVMIAAASAAPMPKRIAASTEAEANQPVSAEPIG